MLSELKSKGIKVIYDRDEKNRPGFKFAEYELKGVPVRIGIGARDIENGVVAVSYTHLRAHETVLDLVCRLLLEKKKKKTKKKKIK